MEQIALIEPKKKYGDDMVEYNLGEEQVLYVLII